VSGPVALPVPEGVSRVDVASAESMLAAVNEAVDGGCDVFVAAAAVADYRPEAVASEKIKKTRESLVIQLTRNPDILATVAARPDRPFCVGFAAETRDVEHYAEDKLRRKKLDMIVANDVSDASIGFNSEHNAVTVLWPGGRHPLARTDKLSLARELLGIVLDRYRGRES
jgi:phosphopantothenoylcysteine decarboxylase/phosphopantothenate--cysteine ligase